MNIQELDSYNLADAVKFNDHLNPRLWTADEHLRPEVREQLLRIAEDFRESLGISDLDLRDITISGSNAAYTYTPNSDIDLHLVVDVPDDKVYRELFNAKKFQYNEQHDITIGGADVELYVQDDKEPHISQGVYSVLNNKWLSVPRRVKSVVDDTSTRNKFETVGHQIERAIRSGNIKRMSRLIDKIKKMRQTGLEAHGEFGPENLVFKMLRTQGKIKQLYDARTAAKDRELSLKEKAPVKLPKLTWGFKTPRVMETAPATELEQPKLSEEDILRDFIHFCVKELKIDRLPTIKLRKDPQWPVVNKTFGRYTNDRHLLEVAWGGRHIMDVLRTVAHELTHKHQHERDGARMGATAGETGSPWENEANARAGILMRDYARLHPDYFAIGQAHDLTEATGYIPTAAEADDPRFKMALTRDVRPGAIGRAANAFLLDTDAQGHPQELRPDGLVHRMMAEYHQFKKKNRLSETVELDEVKMSPSSLMKWAGSPEAQGIRAGFEAELIFRDTASEDSDYDQEPDYDQDERCRSIDQVVDFFQTDDYGYGISDRQAERLREGLDEQYYEWHDERMYAAWKDEQDELIKEAWLEDKPMTERIHAALVDGLELTDEEADAVEALHAQREKGEIKGSDMSEEQLDMVAKYSEARSIAEDVLEEDVEQTIAKQDGFYDSVLDSFRDNFYIDDDRGFFDDVGLRWMSDVSNEYDLGWPYMSGGGNGGSRDPEEIGDSLSKAVGMQVKVSSGYHQATRKPDLWILEPDSSLEPDDREDYGLEIVSPPLPLLTTLEKLQQVVDWANSGTGDAYTNSSTGLHMGVSVPHKGGDVDYVKLILFMGDEHVLQQFGRESSVYCKSALAKFRENIKGGRADPMGVIKYMQSGLLELAHKDIQKGVGTGKYTSAHIQDGYIEFRSPGGDWLSEARALSEDANSANILQNTMLRFARAMQIASDPSAERQEYAKKLYKLVAPEGDDPSLALFARYSAGDIDKEQLKKQWAEKTLGTEKKINQRWKLYQNVNGRWEPVPAAEWNGYTEDQVKNAVWSRYGREALDTGEYQLVNMGEQDWEVYDVKTGKTLEIVKGKSKGEVADAVYDKYVDQGIGFQVRPWEDPAKMSPRAKLAKRIVKPADKKDWDVVYKPTGRVIDSILRVDKDEAKRLLGHVAALHDFENADDLEIRPQDVKRAADNRQDSKRLGATLGVNNVEPDVAQNFDQPQDATNRVGSWSIYDVTLGRELSRMDNVPWSQADARANEIERGTGHNISVRGLSETMVESLPAKNLNQLYKIKQQLANPAMTTAEPEPTAKPAVAKPAQPRLHAALTDLQRQREKIQRILDLKQEIETLTARAGRTRYGITPGLAADIEDIYPNPATEKDMDAAISGYQTQLKKLQDYIARQRRVFPKEDVAENFADGRGPGRPGDSVRHGIPKGATMAELEKASHAKGRKGQLARWQLNMRRGKKK